MGCQDVRNQLSAYLEGELEVAPRRAIEDHLRECVRCQGELVLLQRTIALLQGLDEVEVPPRLSAAIQVSIHPRRRRWWRAVASWLFFPVHVKLPMQVVALLLVSLGAVYLYRTAPELAQAPAPPPVATERATRDQTPSKTAAERSDLDAPGPVRESVPAPAAQPKPAETLGRRAETQADVQKEREVFRQTGAGARVETEEKRESQRQQDLVGALRKEAPPASRAAPLVRELTLKTQDPSQAASRIAEIASAVGGTLVGESDPRQSDPEGLHRLAVTMPPEAYPRFVNALRELGDLSPLPAEPPAAPSPEGSVIVHLRLTR
jgi:hypothetical protein